VSSVAKKSLGVLWPALPFFRPTLPQPAVYSRECRVERPDGSAFVAELAEFGLGLDYVAVRNSGAKEIERLALKDILKITLPSKVTYEPDSQAASAVGMDNPRESGRKPFCVRFQDDSSWQAETLGFLREPSGLFLFVVERGSLEATRTFIPAAQIKDLQIGPPLGDVLVEHHLTSADTLSKALNKQSKLRQEKIGKYLTDRAIISQQDLLVALRAQQKRPAARLGDLLVEAELITSEQLQNALAIQAAHRGRRIGEILIEMGAVSLRLIQFAMSDKLGIPYVNVREFKIGSGALESIDMAMAIKHQVLPLLRTPDSLVVAVEDPFAITIAQELRFHAGINIAPVIANPQDLKARIAKEYANLEGRTLDPRVSRGSPGVAEGDAAAANAAQAKVTDLASQLARESQQTGRASKEATTDARVLDNTLVKLVNKIIIEAHAQGASDIHIESNAGRSETKIRFRKDGDLEDYLDLPPTYSSALVSRLKVMAELDISERRHPQDGKIDFSKHGPLDIELRVAVIPTINNLEDVVLRILAGADAIALDDVGFSTADLPMLRKMISRTYGLVLVCGPTGSGKTTTLHSILRDINRPDIKIWTAEDPVEITQPGLRQVQVQPKIDWTFAAAMRAFLRADPDVIMVGEMRDVETTKIGIEASLTGHLVFSTLHTNSAAESVVRLLDMGMDPFNFADALIGIVSQRLARKLCSSCRQSRVVTPEEADDLASEYCAGTTLDPRQVRDQWLADFGIDGNLILREPLGCDACRDGFKGRVVVYELLSGTPEVKHLIRTHGPVPQIVVAAQAGGMLTLRQNAIDKVLRGTLDLASARAVAS